jgi:uncharacterized protein DUF3168
MPIVLGPEPGAAPAFVTFPDFEAVAAARLRGANITNLGARVYSSVPADPTFPLAVVQRVGGIPPVRRYLDGANIQVDVWGGTKAQARDIADAARRALLQLEGSMVTDPVTAWVSGVDDSLGLTWAPDPETARDRYLFGVLIYGHA